MRLAVNNLQAATPRWYHNITREVFDMLYDPPKQKQAVQQCPPGRKHSVLQAAGTSVSGLARSTAES
jgi:hypothetical protein